MGITLLNFFTILAVCNAIVSTVKNFRPVVPGLIYRSATLDKLSISDAEQLLQGTYFNNTSPFFTVIDLRNSDEIKKGVKRRTDGSKLFYSSLRESQSVHIPLLYNVDAFWDEAISRMDPFEKTKAALQSVFKRGALDRAAARHLECGGLPLLYSVMLVSSGGPMVTALNACVNSLDQGPVLFHCEKGKDRTGLLAMLIQTCLRADDVDIIEAYSLSGDLLGDEGTKTSSEGSNNSLIDWGYFRGSPASAMQDTLQWIRLRHGSIEAYLDNIMFSYAQQKDLREKCEVLLNETP